VAWVSEVQHGDYRWWDRFERGVLDPCASHWPVAMPIDDILEERWVTSDRRHDPTSDQGWIHDGGQPDDGPGHVCQQYLVGRHLEVVLTVRHPAFEIAELAWWGGPPMTLVPYRLRTTAVSFPHGAALIGSLDLEELAEAVVFEVRRLSTRRRRRYRRCQFCREMVPPEERFSPSVCLACASDHLGIVF
jgi:hypothetical protein